MGVGEGKRRQGEKDGRRRRQGEKDGRRRRNRGRGDGKTEEEKRRNIMA